MFSIDLPDNTTMYVPAGMVSIDLIFMLSVNMVNEIFNKTSFPITLAYNNVWWDDISWDLSIRCVHVRYVHMETVYGYLNLIN